MAETNGGELMREMNTYLNQAESGQSDEDTALPFESISDYLGDPTGFNDVTAKLLKKVSAVFDLAGKFNRHSPEYLKSLAQLEKGIKFLGSSCLQKHALEMKNYDFPELKQLNTTNLYTMAALHFNKLDRALTEYMDEHQNVDDGLLDMEYRFYNLMERIRATEVKIYNYRDNYYLGNGNSNPIIHGLAFSEKSWTKSLHEHDEPMAFQRAKAFQFKSEIRNQKSEIQAENEEGRMKKEEKTVASGQCSVDSENKEYSSGRSSENEGMVREQFSKKKTEISGQWSVVSGQLAADSSQQSVDDGNVDGRMKNEEESSADDQCSIVNKETSDAGLTESGSHENTESNETSEDSDNTSHSSLLTPNCSEAADSSLLTPSELPEFIKILERVSMRSRLHNLDYLGFTETEMRQLAADPGFAQFQPEMAAEMRKALSEHDSG